MCACFTNSRNLIEYLRSIVWGSRFPGSVTDVMSKLESPIHPLHAILVLFITLRGQQERVRPVERRTLVVVSLCWIWALYLEG